MCQVENKQHDDGCELNYINTHFKYKYSSKRQRKLDFKKEDPATCCTEETHFQYKVQLG